jgi:hypothetical protein
VPHAGTTVPITIAQQVRDSLGDFVALVIFSAPQVVPETLTVRYTRQATMAGDIVTILQTCAKGCHNSTLSGNYSINFVNSDSAYRSLLSPVTTSPNHTYIVLSPAPDSAASNLYKILHGNAPAGYFNMPTSNCNSSVQTSCMAASDQTRIYIWIMQGALKNP